MNYDFSYRSVKMMLRNDTDALRDQCLRNFLLATVFKKRNFSEKKTQILERKSSIFMKNSILKHFKHSEREERRQKTKEIS